MEIEGHAKKCSIDSNDFHTQVLYLSKFNQLVYLPVG